MYTGRLSTGRAELVIVQDGTKPTAAHFSGMETFKTTDTLIPIKLEGSTRRPSESAGRRAASPIRLRRRTSVTDKPILIVEDEYLIAADLAYQIIEDGGRVVGPALSIHEALDLLRHTTDLGGAVLDVKIDDTNTFELADALTEAGVPLVFFTGYRSLAIPDRFIGVPRIGKPAGWRQLKQGLIVAAERLSNTGNGSFRDSIEAALPTLRREARALVGNPEEADNLVEQTLERAISTVANRSLNVTIEEWLLTLMAAGDPRARRRFLH
jgi:CheY-like chemotaxis protein